jgi:stage II sporulation protein E
VTKLTNSEFGNEINEGRIEFSELGKSAIMQGLYFSIGFLTASASSEEYFSPLGIAFSSGVHRKNTLFSCFGAMAGYIVSNDYIHAFRYVMALILVYILKVYVNTFPNLQKKTYIPAFISLFATISTGIVVMATEPFGIRSVLMRIAEAVISFGAAYFFSVSVNTTEKIGENERITSKEVISLVVSSLALILCLSKISLLGVTPAGVACSYIVMISAYLFKESGGAVIGTGASLGFTMTGNSIPTVFCYAGAGLFSGLFSYSGRVLCACAYIFSYGALYVFLGDGPEGFEPLIETALASVFFVLTPDKLLYQLKMKLSFLSYSGDGREFRNMIIAQLKSVRDAVGDMSETVSRVTQALKEKSAPDTTAVYLRVRDNVCEKCASYNRCWRNMLPATLAEFDEVLETIRKTGSVTPSVTPMSLQSKCIRIMSLCDSFNKNYVLYSAHLGAEGRINEMRKITADQFDTVGEMLDDLLINFESGAKPLASKSLALKNSLDDIGVHAFVNCYEDENMNMVINMSVENDCKASTGEIRDCIIKSTEKQFPYPAVISGENEKMMLFWEQTALSAECVYYQLSGNEETVCGDCFDSFFDGKGNFIAVLSDGMGTGERAAVDGAMASSLFSRLIISGFSFPCALRLVNSAMLVKSYEESLATLDILKVNLYNGQTVIYKAGATASLLYRKGKVSEIKKSAMPIGILRQAEFATIKGGLKNGDVVIMMSDGAVDNSLEEIKKYVTEKGFSYDLPEKLCAIAKAKNKSHSDDITVAVIRIQLNKDD